MNEIIFGIIAVLLLLAFLNVTNSNIDRKIILPNPITPDVVTPNDVSPNVVSPDAVTLGTRTFKWKSTTGEETIIADVQPNKEDVTLYIILPDGTSWKAIETKIPYNPSLRAHPINQKVIGSWEKLLFPNRIPNTEEYWHDFLPQYSSNYDVREGGYLNITNSNVPPTNLPKFLAYDLMGQVNHNQMTLDKQVTLPNDFVNQLPNLSKPVEHNGIVYYMQNFKKRHVPFESTLNQNHCAGNYCHLNPQPISNVIDQVSTGRRSIL